MVRTSLLALGLFVVAACHSEAEPIAGEAAALEASPTVIYRLSTTVAANGTTETTTSTGFWDSSFAYPSDDVSSTSFCYRGPVTGVCRLVEREIDRMNQEYSAGAHDGIDDRGCTVEGDVATAAYHLFDDWGGSIEVVRRIAACGK